MVKCKGAVMRGHGHLTGRVYISNRKLEANIDRHIKQYFTAFHWNGQKLILHYGKIYICYETNFLRLSLRKSGFRLFDYQGANVHRSPLSQ